MLKFEKVSRSFRGPEGEVRAVCDISFSVASGELLAVQGPSGSGKTTLLLMAGGLLRPTEGVVLVDGENPYESNPDRRSVLRAEKIGFVFQQFHLIPYLTVLENVLAPSVTRSQPNALDRARDLIRRFKLEHRSDHVPAQLSTGECQRTALARALLNNPKIILADEPTGNLDEESGKTVLSYLSEFTGNGGAVLLVTHDTRSTDYADRTLRVEAGKLAGG